MKKRVYFIVILATLIFAGAVNAATFYVDTAGDDSITHALLIAKKGDIIKINDGVYNEGQLNVPEGVSLTSTSKDPSRVIIQPKKNLGLSPFVNLSSPNPGSNGNQAVSYLSFNGHSGTYRALVGFRVENRSNVKITHCNIRNFTSSNGAHGVHVKSTEISQTSQWTLYWPADPQAPGVETNINALWPANPVENFELSYCTINNCGYKASIDGPGIKYPAVKPFHLKNSSIHHNTINTETSYGQPIKGTCAFLDNVDIYNNDLTMAYYTGDASPDDPMSSYAIELWLHRRGCEIYNNTSNGMFSITVGKETKIYDNTIIATWTHYSGRGSGIEYILQCEGEVYDNYIEKAGSRGIILGLAKHSGSANMIIRNVKIYNNIIYNARSSSIFVQNRNARSGDYTVENIEVYNNICDDLARPETSSGLFVISSYMVGGGTGSVTTQNVKFKNNICVNAPGYAGTTNGKIINLVIDENLFFNNYEKSWSGSTPTKTIIEDPRFEAIGDHSREYYELKTDSPMWDVFNEGEYIVLPPGKVEVESG
jgi:hypothetical protein